MPAGHYKRNTRPVIIPIGPSIAYLELTQGQFSLIGADDASTLGGQNWCAHYKKESMKYYATGTTSDRKTIQLHAFMFGGMCDHKNGDTLDNRRCNLRPAKVAENSWNRGKSKTNTSGFKGVFWHKNRHKWVPSISVHSKRIHLGSFDCPKLAHEAYIIACLKYHGDFACTG